MSSSVPALPERRLDRRTFGMLAIAAGLTGCRTAAPLGGIDPEAHPHLHEKYPRLLGSDCGWYEGLAENGRYYRLPRRVDSAADGPSWIESLQTHYAVGSRSPASMDLDAMVGWIGSTLPASVKLRVDGTLKRAQELADSDAPTAAPFPGVDEVERLRRTLLLTWAHSRDIEVLLKALGYPSKVAGRHDVEEPVLVSEVQAASEGLRERQSDWYLRYIDSLDSNSWVNVGFFNPHFVVDAFRWRPGSEIENSVVAHRLSQHHRGAADLHLDPIEGAVNHLHHRRENRLGVRKDPCMTFEGLGGALENPETARSILRSEFGASVGRDALTLMRRLELQGKITPWFLCRDC